MASWVRDRLNLGSSKNSNVVNNKKVSCQINNSQCILKPMLDETILLKAE